MLVGFNARCDRLAVAGDGAVKVWSANGECSEMNAENESVWSCLAWCRLLKQDGKKKKKKKKLIVALGAKNGIVLAWDPAEGEIKWKINSDSDESRVVQCICFAQLQQRLYVAGADGLVREIDAHSGEVQGEIRVAHNAVSAMAISLDGRRLVVGTGEALKLYNLETKKKIRTLTSNFSAKALAFVGDGAYILAASEQSCLSVFSLVGSERVVSSLALEHSAVAVDSWGFEQEGTHVSLLAVTEAGEAYIWSEVQLEDMGEAKPLRLRVAAEDHTHGNRDCYIVCARFFDSHSVYIARGRTGRPVFEKITLEGLTETVLLGVAPLITAEKLQKRKRGAAGDPQSSVKQPERSKRARSVSFGGVTVIDNKEEKQEDHQDEKQDSEEPDEYRYKWFTKEEDAILMQAANDAVKAAGWPLEDGLQRLLGMVKCTTREDIKQRRNCWKSITSSIPYRRARAVRNRAEIVIDIFSKKGKWDAEENERFCRLMEKHGHDWKKIAEELGRDRRDVRYKWRYMRNQNRRGFWSVEETEKLCQLVHENLALNKKYGEDPRKQILGLNWTAIGNALGTRPDSSCMRRWYDLLASRKIRSREWEPSDDHKLLLSLLESGVPDEEYIEWDQLLPHRSKDACKARWDEMVRALGPRHKCKSFETKLEMLVKRYAPSILEDNPELDEATVGAAIGDNKSIDAEE